NFCIKYNGLNVLLLMVWRIMLELAGENAKLVRLTVPLRSGGVTDVCIGSVVMTHAKFIVGFHGVVDASIVQVSCHRE
ncbi:MAG: hypothetical protein ACK56I_35300, partial [bacterium]